MKKLWPLAAGLFGLGSAAVSAQTYVDEARTVAIDVRRGADELVDYAALVRIGPWDDRNYDLTRADLALLPPNEAELRSPIPAFFRVGLRRALPSLRGDPAARYPLSAFNAFRLRFGGYLVDGRLYTEAHRKGGRYYVVLEKPAAAGPTGSGNDFVSGDVRVTSPEGAAESAIAVDPADTNRLVAGTNGPNGGQRMHYSTDGGASWTQVELPQGGTCCDPTVEWSSDGRYAYTATLGGCFFFCRLWFYRSDDGGLTWNGLENVTPGNPRREISNNADREYLHVDRSAASPYKDSIYLMYHEGNVMQFARSTDFGNTWSTLSFSNASADRGIAGDIATDRGGTIYYAWPAFNSRTIRLRVSHDGGATFGPVSVVADTNASFSYPLPSQESREVAVYLAMDADTSSGPYTDSVYIAWPDTTAPPSGVPADNHSQIHVAYSRDGGATWHESIPHETADVLTVDRWQPFLAVGPDGTVHVIYNDTRIGDRTSSDVFYSYSTDGARTWSAPRRVTGATSPNIADGFEFGDYSGLDIVMNDLIAIFTDNRNEAGGGGDSIDVYASGIAPGGGGGGAGRIPGARGVSGGAPLTVARSGGDLQLDWSPACGAGSDYGVYEGELGLPDSAAPVQCTTGGQTSATITPSMGQRFYLVVAQSGGNEGSYGRRSDDTERPPAANACLPQAIGTCP
ncbi:MAG: exo-alpha-sialidase [Acidobacteria bacterium]|nr:MAG: exo-alpha-sialidase [Acidobacteriota bacterium]